MASWQYTLFWIASPIAIAIWLFTARSQGQSRIPFITPEDFGITFNVDLRRPSEFQWNNLFTKAYKKFRSPFRILMPGNRDCVVLPPSYIDEIKNNSDLSFDATLLDLFPSYVPGFAPLTQLGSQSKIFHKALRMKLTQSLAHFTDDLSQDARQSMPQIFVPKKGWQETVLKDSILDLVTSLSSLIFLGRDFKHREEWQKISSTYTVNIFNASRVLSTYGPWVRPIVHWFLPECQMIKEQRKKAAAIIEPEVKARRERREQDRKEGKITKKSLDSVDWFEEVRDGEEFDIVSAELLLAVVAIETTTHTLTNAILDIVTQAGLIEDIRKEIVEIINEDGGLKKTTLYKARLLDSVIKESQRLRPVGQGLMDRIALNDITLKDGTTISKTNHVLIGPMPHWDAEYYPDPFKFDGYRFARLREQPGNETKWQFASTQVEHIGFGHGQHACPGRFFAANEIKIALMHMVMNYDWKFSDGEERPKDLEVDIVAMPNPEAKLMYKARTPEVVF